METRARYILVGAFTMVCVLAALGFILWLAKVQLDRTYAQYDIRFDSVAGLAVASAVQYNGVDVGQVLNIALDREDPSLVRVRIEVYASTPIRADTTATLSSQGVTGVSYVGLEGGSADSLPLEPPAPGMVPVIQSKPSLVQGLITDAPDLLAEAISLMEDIREFTTPENSDAIASILKNVESASGRIDTMAAQTESVMVAAKSTLERADAALAEAQEAFAAGNQVIGRDLPDLVATLKAAVDDVGQAAAGLEDFTSNGLPQFTSLAADARGLISSIGALTNRIGNDPTRFFLGTQTPAYRR